MASIGRKNLNTYVQLTLTTCTFDLCMSKRAYVVFAIVVNFISSNKEPKDTTIGLFGIINIGGVTIALKFQQLFDKISLIHKIFVYVKNEMFNL